MDINKTLAAINTFQNAMDRNRTFMSMIQAASDLWEQIGQINPDELKALADAREGLTGEINSLTERRNNLQNDVNGLQTVFDAKFNGLQASFEAQKADLQNSQNAIVSELTIERDRLYAEIQQLKQQQENAIAEFNAKKSTLEGQIASLRTSLTQASHALQ